MLRQIFKEFVRICLYRPGIFNRITLAIWGDNALVWADLLFFQYFLILLFCFFLLGFDFRSYTFVC